MYIDCEMTDSLLSRMLPDEDDAKYFCNVDVVDVTRLMLLKLVTLRRWRRRDEICKFA